MIADHPDQAAGYGALAELLASEFTDAPRRDVAEAIRLVEAALARKASGADARYAAWRRPPPAGERRPAERLTDRGRPGAAPP